MMAQSTGQLSISYRHIIHEQLGAGAMGAVYRAYDRLSGQYVALKRVMTHSENLEFSSRHTDTMNPSLALAHEFRMLASLRHPHVISVQDYGFDEQGLPYFTMTLLEDPHSILDAGLDAPLQTQIGLLVQALQALAYVHRRGLLHRDLKPSNVLVKDGHTYVLDFGLAKERDTHGADADTVGTLAYIAPEVLMQKPASEASDLYAIGVIAYEMIARRHPFRLDNIVHLMNDIISQPPDLTTLDVSEALRLVLARLLAKDPADRYASANDTINALCAASGLPVPPETAELRESYLQAARFVGRQTEMEKLVGVLRAALDGQGSAWLIGGESGVGKSRLLEELRTRALVTGALTLRGQGISERALPYQVWREPVRRLVLAADCDDDEAAILGQMVPDLARLLERSIPDPPDLDVNTYQRHLFLTIEALVRRAAQRQPVVLLLEDLQWASESLKLLEQVAQMAADLPLLIVGTYTTDIRTDLPDLLPALTPMLLERLSAEEIATLSDSMLGRSGSNPAVVDLLQRETEGNVFFLIEVVRSLAESAGSLTDIGAVTLPPRVFAGGVQRIVEGRLQRVPEWARPMIRLAALAGRWLDLKVLAALDPDLDVNAWLTLGIEAAVFDVQDETPRFAHDKIREVVLATLEPDERPGLHRQLAQAIERAYADQLDAYAAVLVDHWAAAGDAEREARYVLAAARQSYETNHYHKAWGLYQRAIELRVYEQEADPLRSLANIQHRLGITLYSLGEYDQARPLYQAALDHHRQIDDAYGISEALAALSELDMRQGSYDSARRYLEESMSIREQLGNQKNIAFGLMNMGIIEYYQGNLDRVLDLFQRCYDIMRTQDDPISTAKALNNLGNINTDLGNLRLARELHEEALAIRRRLNDRIGIAYSLLNLSSVEISLSDYDKAQRMLLEALGLLRVIGEKLALTKVLNSLGNIAEHHENYDEARAYHEESLALCQQMGDRQGYASTLHYLGGIARKTGEPAVALVHYRQALKLCHDIGAKLMVNGLLVDIASTLSLLGRHAEALELLLLAKRQAEAREAHTDYIDEEIRVLGAKLKPPDFLAARERGLALTLDEAIARYT